MPINPYLWKASLETISFMPLSSADPFAGLIITDWYSENNPDESIKIVIKFLSNEIRADGIEIDIRKKSCNNEKKPGGWKGPDSDALKRFIDNDCSLTKDGKHLLKLIKTNLK